MVQQKGATGIYTLESTQYFPTEEQQRNYRKLLQDIGLDPHSILSEYLNHGKYTVIVESPITNLPLASFLYILLNWARQESVDLEDALQVVVISSLNALSPPSYITIGQGELYIPCINIFADRDLLLQFTSGIDEGPNTDRLVPNYPPHSWDETLDNFIELDKPRVAKIIQKLTAYVKKHLKISNIETAEVNAAAEPTINLSTSPNDVNLPEINFQIPSTSSEFFGSCNFHSNCFKRQLTGNNSEDKFTSNPFYLIFTYNTTGSNTLNRTVYDTLLKEYALSFNSLSAEDSFINFVENELKKPFSSARNILKQACNLYQESSKLKLNYMPIMFSIDEQREKFMRESCQNIFFLLLPPTNLLYCLAEGY